jgi:hypothetical protein
MTLNAGENCSELFRTPIAVNDANRLTRLAPQAGFEPATLRLTAQRRWLGSQVLRAGSSGENLLIRRVWQRIVQRLFRRQDPVGGTGMTAVRALVCRTSPWAHPLRWSSLEAQSTPKPRNWQTTTQHDPGNDQVTPDFRPGRNICGSQVEFVPSPELVGWMQYLRGTGPTGAPHNWPDDDCPASASRNILKESRCPGQRQPN